MLTRIKVFFTGIWDTLCHTEAMIWIMIQTMALIVWTLFITFIMGLRDSFVNSALAFERGLGDAQDKAEEMSKTIEDTLKGIFS